MARQRNALLGWLRLVSVYAFLVWIVWNSRPTPGDFLLGLGPVLLGTSIRFWAAGHLLKSKELVTSGPYAYTQNPLYLGRAFLFIGFCLMARMPRFLNLAVLAVGLAIFAFYYIPRKIRVEGARLAELHGKAWRAYTREMPVLVPRMTPYSACHQARWRMDRMLRNREYLMVIGVVGVCLIFAGKAWGYL